LGVGEIKVHPLSDEVAGLTLQSQVDDVRTGCLAGAEGPPGKHEDGESKRIPKHKKSPFTDE
jgi:hypothetical protein